MQQLSLHDRRHVEAAKGWCQLYAFADANQELEHVTPECRDHPDVLEVRWQISANTEDRECALELADAVARKLPGSPQGYIYAASSLRELGRVDEALLILLQAVERFPQDEIILYDLPCVSCLLGNLEEARTWLRRAVDAGGDEIRKRALDDPDLEQVWQSA